MDFPVVVIACVWLAITGLLALAVGGALLWRRLQRRARERGSEPLAASSTNNSLPTS